MGIITGSRFSKLFDNTFWICSIIVYEFQDWSGYRNQFSAGGNLKLPCSHDFSSSAYACYLNNISMEGS